MTCKGSANGDLPTAINLGGLNQHIAAEELPHGLEESHSDLHSASERMVPQLLGLCSVFIGYTHVVACRIVHGSLAYNLISLTCNHDMTPK